MRSKALVLTIGLLTLLLAAPFAVTAQDRAQHPVVVPLSEGGFVAFKSETAWADRSNSSSKLQEVQGTFESKALVDEGHIIHRVLVDARGNFVFGYDLFVEAQPGAKQFTIAVNPIDAKFAGKLLAKSPEAGPSLKAGRLISTLPRSAEPQLLDDGDSFALDLLINRNTGVKIVDVVKVSFDRSTLWEANPTLPRDFTLDAVELTVKDYRLLINGEVVAAGKPASDWRGALLWFYAGDRGRFIFSLVPREGYQFQKVGVIENNRIEFTIKGDHYEWISNAPVLPGGGTWNLWVLPDPKYVPLTENAPPDPKKKKDKLDQLDAAVKKVEARAKKIRDQKQTTFHTSGDEVQPDPSGKRFRIIVGGADRIENLWPRQ